MAPRRGTAASRAWVYGCSGAANSTLELLLLPVMNAPSAPMNGATTAISEASDDSDPIATPNSARDLLSVYPNAPVEISVHAPSDFGARRIGHEGAFRKDMEPLWDRIFHWLDNGDARSGAYIERS